MQFDSAQHISCDAVKGGGSTTMQEKNVEIKKIKC